MKRPQFMLLAGALAFLFSIMMLVTPDQMLGNVSTITNEGARNVVRWLGANLFAIGVINLLARHDAGSEALRAIMIGNIVLHVVALTLDIMDNANGIVKTSGVIMGAVVHVGLALGFLYYLRAAGSAKQAVA
jgi:hypothetical protein